MNPNETYNGIKTFFAKDRKVWRQWLEQNHESQKSVWVILSKKDSSTPSASFDEVLEEGLCYGWVDSKSNKRDEQSYYVYYAKRNPRSNWSKVNKEKVERLIKDGKMAPSGWEMIKIAKESGTWDALHDVDHLIEPPDLIKALKSQPTAMKYWKAFPPSIRRGILEWIFNAKRPTTRAQRINETATLAENNIRANEYKK